MIIPYNINIYLLYVHSSSFSSTTRAEYLMVSLHYAQLRPIHSNLGLCVSEIYSRELTIYMLSW